MFIKSREIKTMYGNDLRDLSLYGIKWELEDTPVALRSMKQAVKPEISSVEYNVDGRTKTTVVPPIEPVVGMSVDTVRSMAGRPCDMLSLNRMISEFNHPLRAGATNVVLPSVASAPNGLVIITDIPSGEDDISGKILSGGAGDLLDKMLSAINMTRENVSIVPLVFWRTPGGRTPSQSELDLTRPFVDKALDLLKPRVILTLGTLAANQVAGVNLPKAHGSVNKLESGAVCVPIFHPNYLMLKPAAKRDAWTALQLVQNLLKSADE